MQLLDRIDAVIAEKSLLKHPFYVAWTEGKLTREMLQKYAIQYYALESMFSRLLAVIHANCSDLQTRQAILGNMQDEEMGERNHPELWLRFSEGLGLKREEVLEAQYLPETKAMINTLRALVQNPLTACALAVMYAYESQVPEVARTKIEGLKKWYGIEKADVIDFFTVHEKTDEWHAEVERNIFLKAAAQNPAMENEIVESVSKGCDALNMLLDGVYHNYCEKELQNCM